MKVENFAKFTLCEVKLNSFKIEYGQRDCR